MNSLVPLVEKTVAAKLPDKSALIFDGWDSDDGPNVRLFASYPASTTGKYKVVLLAFSRLENPQNSDAGEDISFIDFNFEIFGKEKLNVIVIDGDKSSLNKSILQKMKCGFVGCSSHRYNLPLKDFLEKIRLQLRLYVMSWKKNRV